MLFCWRGLKGGGLIMNKETFDKYIKMVSLLNVTSRELTDEEQENANRAVMVIASAYRRQHLTEEQGKMVDFVLAGVGGGVVGGVGNVDNVYVC